MVNNKKAEKTERRRWGENTGPGKETGEFCDRFVKAPTVTTGMMVDGFVRLVPAACIARHVCSLNRYTDTYSFTGPMFTMSARGGRILRLYGHRFSQHYSKSGNAEKPGQRCDELGELYRAYLP
ncbi:hypothetical protein B5X24_HaOG203958 [Helicoverpa armigera]|uniref:Uncharacterized protein n=1 Tax=Helicoverpa armigera TaxID=29058 RepID=A0A2W1BUY6_HELAM|nr:hypothetical protein B5X24_HaOG203958 [Helicoverpa armigera]